ncbi:hypothetical protein KP014_20165 [Paenibacillus sophorae]|nr:hypothetical protein [Paenibacillus sophorae]QWU14228.1 hypothetical protein KP014_20165 [Paenibacillus sophorae]
MDVKAFNNAVREKLGGEPHLIHFTYGCGPEICDHEDSQYIKASSDFLINKQESSEHLALKVFNANNIYPVFQVFSEGHVIKLRMTTLSGRLTIEIKGYLIDRQN